MLIGLILILVFVLMALWMFSGKIPAILALPLLAFLLTVVAGLPYYFFSAPDGSFMHRLIEAVLNTFSLFSLKVVGEGFPRLHQAMIAVMLGGIFGQLLKLTGIGETLVKKVAELSGDNPLTVSLFLTLTVAFLFTGLGGLGSVILVANIYFPVLLSLGIPSLLAGSLFLMAMSLGGAMNMVNWTLYMDILGLSQREVFRFAAPFALIFLALILVFFLIEFKRNRVWIDWKVIAKILGLGVVIGELGYLIVSLELITPDVVFWTRSLVVLFILCCALLPLFTRKAQWPPLLAPAMPILAVLVLGWPILMSLLLGVIYLFITSLFCGEQSPAPRLIQAIIEGISGVVPAIAVMMGIGMVLIAVTQQPISVSLTPVLMAVIPHTLWQYVLVFALAAPLALYRGPLNLWGMGSGLMGILRTTLIFGPRYVMIAFFSTGMVQGVCDPTNTHNVWIANHLKLEVNALLRKTLPWMWGLAFLGLLLGVAT